MAVTIDAGFTEAERPQVARLYWQAFGAKLGKVLGPDRRALAFLEQALTPEFALVARRDGALLGVAGFQTPQGGLVGGGFAGMARVYGLFGAAWRAALLSVLERRVEAGIFQMDGIFVSAGARGQGVGAALLEAVALRARQQGARAVRLDVIDTNPRAEQLYRRVGFQPLKREHTGPFKWVFGFGSALKMERPV
ncbi:GNAT family N-acetyltransferase [Thalassobius sp. S69A]|uniref:GNAT family N-acetyltransferase n=1 Tax=unclassified Thalassovita TaxID=2619711 RepID=UPI000C0CCC8D|nr:N-acetyltransferase [Paracoccaceae bacterium]MBT25112.1 N-acetyltransferase [Paracoccaceae bacterium]